MEPRDGIAITGLACRFPGANSVHEFWSLLAGARSAVTAAPTDRQLHSPTSSRRGAFVERIDAFDYNFFKLTKPQADALDPQQRLFLELGFDAVQDAGIPRRAKNVGVFVGSSGVDYNLLLRPGTEAAQLMASNLSSAIAGRFSYSNDLVGPSLGVDASCASSLVALDLACASLLRGHCDYAVVGGVGILLSGSSDDIFRAVGLVSPTGQSRPFDDRADGHVRGEGCGVVVLRRLADARADGDRAYAVVRGTAVNHSGVTNGFLAPKGKAQVDVIRRAFQDAGLSPSDAQLFMTHGTSTKLGDAIELNALGQLLRASPSTTGVTRSLVSIKGNIGHLEAASGIASVIATVLALGRRQIPATVGFESPNSHVVWAELNAAVTTELRPWTSTDGPLVAGVSAFGFTGTNAHAVLTESPYTTEASPRTIPNGSRQLPLTISAATPAALAMLTARFGAELHRLGEAANIEAWSYTSTSRRRHLPHRLVVLGRNATEWVEALDRFAKDSSHPDIYASKAAPPRAEGESELRRMAHELAAGKDPDWSVVWPGPPGHPGQTAVATLPAYPWEHERCWLDSLVSTEVVCDDLDCSSSSHEANLDR